MAYNPRRSAREDTPWGSFELTRSHLITDPVTFADPEAFTPDPAQARQAQLTVAEHVAVEEIPEVLDMLGILEQRPSRVTPIGAARASGRRAQTRASRLSLTDRERSRGIA